MWGRSLYQNIQRFILFQMTGQCGGVSYRTGRSSIWYAVPPDSDADAVGQSNYGYLRRDGFGFAATYQEGDERGTERPSFYHR